MQSKQYKSKELNSLLETLRDRDFSGTFYLETHSHSNNYCSSCVFIWRDGELTYGGSTIPNNLNFAKMLVKKFKPDFINVAMQTAREKLGSSPSFREILELFVKIKIFTWEQVETCVYKTVVFHLDRVWQSSGTAKWKSSTEFDLSYGEDRHGLKWSILLQELNNRQQKWDAIKDTIPLIDAIPYRAKNFDKIDSLSVKNHLQKYVDGNRSLLAIADQMERDPLAVAQTYSKWAEFNWVKFKLPAAIESQVSSNSNSSTRQTTENSDLPMILSVDDSPIVRKSIERALKDYYRVALASNAIDALSILNSQPVRLILLDLTMPDIDGLQFCKSVKKIPKFQDLPIVMVTARDGLLDRMKGHLAGTDKYITKPFKPEELREIVNKYINTNVT